jgi:D-alanyl-D-alanine carboxypeptidase (penicillin-binding protein 5/6)
VRTQESQKLLNWGFQNFDTVKLYSKASRSPRRKSGKARRARQDRLCQDVMVTVPKGVAAKMKPALERKDPLVAPLAENSRVGTLKMVVDGKPMLELPVVALETVEQASIFGRAWDSIRLWLK